MSWYVRGSIALLFTLLFGCASEPPRRPAVVSYLDIAQKQLYIRHAMSTLEIFREAAVDLQIRRKRQVRRELAAEVGRYIELQVKPIMDDFEAGNSPMTRLEVAELQLLCAMVYLELKEYDQVLVQLKDLKRRYGDNPEIMTASLNPGVAGFRNIEDGLRVLHQRLFREFLTFSPAPSS